MALLPTEKTLAKRSITDFTVLLYGDPKVGKTTFASQMDDPIFLATEAGLNGLDAYQVPTDSWETLLKACAELNETDKFNTVIIDTIDVAYDMCLDYECRKHGMEHPSDLEYGKGWSFVTKEFSRVLGKLALSNRGLVLISHTKRKSIKTNTAEITRVSPSTTDSTTVFLAGFVDIMFYVDIKDSGERVILTQGDRYREGGGRMSQYFPAEMPLDYKEVAKVFETIKKGTKK